MQYDRQITISHGNSRLSTAWEPQTVLISAFYERLRTPKKSPESLSEFFGLKKAQQDDLKDVGGFVGGSLNGPRRKASNMVSRDVITLDFDNVPGWQTEALMQRVEELNCGYCIYSTRKHTPAAPRLRVVIPTDRTMTTDEYEPCARLIAQRIGFTGIDSTTFEIARLMFYPSVCADSEYIFKTADKPLLCVSNWLGIYSLIYGKDWHDVASWPQIPGAEEKLHREAEKAQIPTEKQGIVGAFCRTYDIYRAIEELLPGVYTSSDKDDARFTYTAGSTSGGAVIYDCGAFLFSYHSTDPCSGRLVNAFDLVRLHKFGSLDDKAAPGTPVSRLPSYTAMREYAASLPDVHIEAASAAADFAGLESAPGDDESWKQQLDTSPAGGLKNSLKNIVLILENDTRFRGKLRKDLFNDRIIAKDMPWERPDAKPWDDTDTDHLRIMLERTVSGKIPIADIYSAVNATADKNSFHPVKDYLSSLTWDGVPRLDTLFIDYLGVDDTPYNRAVCRKSFTAAVARIMNPGCKYDCMAVLVGGQGRFKSTILATMGGPWFSDSLRTFEGKEAEERLRGAWIIEVSELQAFDRSSVEAIKGFLSKQTDRYRPAYGRMMKEYPRECVFFGTTNTPDFLRDTTGGRRFWPVDIDRQSRTKSVIDDLPKERDQIWAEAVHYFKAGETLYLTGEVEQAAISIQEDHREVDTWEGMLLDFIAKPIPEDWDNWSLERRRDFWAGQLHTGEGDVITLVDRQRVSSTEFLCEALNFAPKSISKQDTVRVNKILRALSGWERGQDKDRYRTPYSRVRPYVRKQ